MPSFKRSAVGCATLDLREMGVPAVNSVAHGFLAEGGEAGALMRRCDWSATSVGSPSTWPASLKTAVGILLRSRHPMFLWWGPDLIQFYNDAYTPSFGVGKHPAAMGQRGRDCWQEIWPIIWPQIDDVMSRGIASWNEDQLVPIFRNGRIEEVYWTYGYSPVVDDAGAIGGTLVVCTETTNRVLSSRRLESLRALSQAATFAADAPELVSRAAGALERWVHDIPFALLYLIDTNSTQHRFESAGGMSADDATALDAALGPHLVDLASAGTPVPLPHGVTVPGSPWPEAVDHVSVVPVVVGSGLPAGYFVFGLSPRLPFNEPYAQYLRHIAELIAQGFARIEAFRIRALVEGERNQLLEQAPVATALMTGPRHVFRLANPLYREIVGRKDIVGHEFRELFPELRDGPLPGILDEVYLTGQQFVTNEMAIPIDRSGTGVLDECYFKFNLEPIRNASGRIDGMMVVAVDVTPQVLARKTLERTQAEREQLLRDLQAANRAKDEFLAMLGHELRNPLSPILTALELMKLRGVQGVDRERAIIERQVRHVVGLVDDLLDVSRITRGQIALKRERIRLSDVLAKAIEQASPLIEQRNHRLGVDVSPHLFVDGDAARLSQVVSNLLTNAAKYTERGGIIDVRARRQDDAVVLEVTDNGIGIAPEVLPHVFDAFRQERQNDRDHSIGGLGLGLAIVKNLIQAHDGEVELTSGGKGHGTQVIVRLPMATGAAEGALSTESTAVPTPTVAGYRVLVVDDNEDAGLLLAESLQAMGHTIELAFDASSAIAIADRYVPDVALLDIGLPVMDGYELAQRLQSHQGWQVVRFAALTGYGQQYDRDKSRAAGFDAHLVKPIDLELVDATIRRLAPASPAPTN